MTPTSATSALRPEQARHAIGAIFLVNGALFATWAVNIPGVRDQLHLTAGQLGGVLLCVGIGSLLTMPRAGGWLAHWGSDRVTRLAVVLCMLVQVLPFLMPNFWILGLALAVLGGVNGVLDVAMNAQGVTIEQALGRPVMSRLHAYFSLGSVLGAGLGTLLVGRVPMLTHVLLVAAVTTVVGYLAGRVLIPDVPQVSGESQQAADHGGGAVRGGFGLSPAVFLLGALCFLGMLSEGANYDWAALYYRDVLGQTGGNVGIGYTAFVVCMTLGRWFGDRFRTRFGDEAMVRGGAALTVVGLALALLVHGLLPATLGFALAGLGLSNVVPVMYGTAGHALAGKGIAQVATIGYGGFLLGAVLIVLLGGQAFTLVRRNSPAT